MYITDFVLTQDLSLVQLSASLFTRFVCVCFLALSIAILSCLKFVFCLQKKALLVLVSEPIKKRTSDTSLISVY